MLMLVESRTRRAVALGKKLEAVVVDRPPNGAVRREGARDDSPRKVAPPVLRLLGPRVSRKSCCVFNEPEQHPVLPVQIRGEESERKCSTRGAPAETSSHPVVELPRRGSKVERWVLAG